MKKLIVGIWMVFLFKGLHAKNVDVWVEGGNGSVYAEGERVSVKVLPHVSGYLYLYNIDSEGRVHLLFPKRGHSNYVVAGRIYHLPYDFGLSTEWYASDEPGIEYIYAVVTPYPLPYVETTWFVPLHPDEYYYDDGVLVCFRFSPPYFFPRIYFYGWAYFYVRPRYYVYYYHPVPWYCYDCHHPHLIVGFWFDFCPLYVIEVYDCCSYYYYPRYYRTYRYKYRIRPIYRKISPKKVREYREIEKRYRNYDKPPVWTVKNPLREKKEIINKSGGSKIYREKSYRSEIYRPSPQKEVKANQMKTYPVNEKKVKKSEEVKKTKVSEEKKKVKRVESYKDEPSKVYPSPKNTLQTRSENSFRVDRKNARTYNYRNPFKVKR